MPRVVRRERLVPNIHLLEVEAPEIARNCRPGQFVMVMPDARGETDPPDDRRLGPRPRHRRVRLHGRRHDDPQAGPARGRGQPAHLRRAPGSAVGDRDRSGPCFSPAAASASPPSIPSPGPIKAAGNRVVVLVDIKADYLLYWRDKLEPVADEFIISSRDGLIGATDYVPRHVRDILGRGRIDRVVAVGCTYLMSSIAEATRPSGVKTVVSLNPIMVDGTGMCGACRVTVDGRTRFACVDGPDFDGHLVDWAELYARRRSYFDDEIRSLCAWEEERFP